LGALEVDKVPSAGGVVRLHALKSIDVQGLTLEVNRSILGGDGTFGNATRPEGMSQGSPWVFEVGAVQGCACGTNLEARGSAGDLQVDDGVLVVHALDGVVCAILGQLEGAVIGVKTRLVLAEILVVEGR
jgi:hypothetical protein